MSTNTIAEKNVNNSGFSIFSRITASFKAKKRTIEIHFNPVEKSKISGLLEKKDFRQLATIKPIDHGTKMVITISRDHNYGSIQIFDYIPYKYVEASPLYEFTEGNAQNLFEELNGKLL